MRTDAGGASFLLEFSRPDWLLGLVILVLVAYYHRRTLVDFARWQRIASTAVRATIVLLLALALAGLTLLSPTREQFVVLAVDRSLSIGPEARKAADALVERVRAGAGPHRLALLPFAAAPGRIQELARARQHPAPESLDDRGTNLAAALEVAAAAIPPFYVPRIVLVTDGNATDGDALEAASMLRSGLPVDTIPLPARTEPEVQVAGVETPAQVALGEPFHVEVVVDSNHDDPAGRIEVYRGDVKVIDEARPLRRGENRFRFSQVLEQGGLTAYAARVRAARDTLLDNNQDLGLVSSAGKPRILLVESDPDQANHLAWALEEQDLAIDVRPPQGLPETLSELQNYDLLILSNVPATALREQQMAVARSFVQELGGGLIMLGGDQSFGLGGYYKTTIEEILPVRSNFEKEKEKPSLAMVIVLDKSGSMGGEKIEMAKEAARSAVELLGPADQVGILAFEGETFEVSALHPAADRSTLVDRIASLEAGGGTDMAPAMAQAYDMLRAAAAKLKHVIILTDGISAPGDFEGLARDMAAEQITVSTVAMGSDADQPLLDEIARIGGGRYYVADDPSSVPQIFAKETMEAGKSAINEQPFVPAVIRPSRVLAGLDLEAAPLLLGYVITRPKPTSEVILATESGDPLLAWWRYGLGLSVAFTSDAKSRWGAEWVNWPDFGRFWAQVTRHALRRREARGATQAVVRTGKQVRVTLDAADPSGQFVNEAQAELTVIDPRLGSTRRPMTQIAPGRYEAVVPVDASGSYLFDSSLRRQGETIASLSRGLAVGYPDELRLRPTNETLLRTIARTTRGRFNPAPASLFADDGRTAPRATPLWPYLVLAAAFLFVADVALRRIDLASRRRPDLHFSARAPRLTISGVDPRLGGHAPGPRPSVPQQEV